jgi:ectoine hydroxylase-related dioxygenase (phytanoyl-CoA dioxygenase family)
MTVDLNGSDTSARVKDYRRNGTVHIPGAFDERAVKVIAAAFDHCVANLSTGAMNLKGWSHDTFITDSANRELWKSAEFQRLIRDTPIADIAQRFSGGQNLWLYYEQIFYKEGKSRRTPWHQDTSYLSFEGDNTVRIWMTLDPLPRDCQLEFVSGSHKGPLYNAASWGDTDETEPLYTKSSMPRLPEIERDRDAFEILSWDVGPADAVLFHPAILHGGAPTRAGGKRRTISLLFIGDDVRYVPRPSELASSGALAAKGNKMHKSEGFASDQLSHLRPGDPFRLPGLIQLRP